MLRDYNPILQETIYLEIGLDDIIRLVGLPKYKF